MARKKMSQREKLSKRQELLIRGENLLSTYDAVNDELGRAFLDCIAIGMNMNSRGQVRDHDRISRKAWDLINFRELSRELAGGDLNITRNNIPIKYAVGVFKAVKAMENMLRRLNSQKYQRTMYKERISSNSKRTAKWRRAHLISKQKKITELAAARNNRED